MNDDITKRVVLAEPLERVWNAIADSAAYGTWFGAAWNGPFVVGKPTAGHIVPTTVDAEIAAAQEPFAGLPITLHIDTIEPLQTFAFRWNASPDSDILTTVTFRLTPVDEGVELTITESGFDALPTEVRDTTRDDKAGGWEAQTRLIAGFLEQNA